MTMLFMSLNFMSSGRVILPDVAERRRSQQRIGNGMGQHVGIAVAFQANIVRDFDPPDDALAARGETMHVDSDSNAVHKISELTLPSNLKQRREIVSEMTSSTDPSSRHEPRGRLSPVSASSPLRQIAGRQSERPRQSSRANAIGELAVGDKSKQRWSALFLSVVMRTN
jgi:hypothetical protein